MPKNPVNALITDQEMNFARLVLSGTMTDRQAAEAAGLKPSAAAYTKSKPCVQAYMADHRAAVKQKLIDQEAEGLRNLNLGRDRILGRLWELASLAPNETRGSITGQLKALSIIVAIEGLIPGGRVAPGQPVTAPVTASMYVSEWRRKKLQAEANNPDEAQAAAMQEPEPPPPSKPEAKAPSPNLESNRTTAQDTPFTYDKGTNWVPGTMDPAYDFSVNTTGPFRLPMPSLRNPFRRGR